MSPILLVLAERYRSSKAGREGGSADFVTDFRDLLKFAASHDGEARSRAEDDVRRAVYASGGLISLDLHPRDPNIIHRVRLRPDGEGWLFQEIGQQPPSVGRRKLADFFRLRASDKVPHRGWRPWLENMSASALAGKSVMPFERDNMALNEELLHITAAILTWPEASLIRYASAVICRDSKRLEVLHARLLHALRAITGIPETTLESFQILQVPRAVLVHGPFVLKLPRGDLDFGILTGPVAVSGTDLQLAGEIQSTARACLTVENESVFRELAKRNSGILLICTSFPGAATLCLIQRLPPGMAFHHFGDSDPAGFEILRDLREKTGRTIQALGMEFRPSPNSLPLTDVERKTTERLLESPYLKDVRSALKAILECGSKGDYEQESLAASGLRSVLSQITEALQV